MPYIVLAHSRCLINEYYYYSWCCYFIVNIAGWVGLDRLYGRRMRIPGRKKNSVSAGVGGVERSGSGGQWEVCSSGGCASRGPGRASWGTRAVWSCAPETEASVGSCNKFTCPRRTSFHFGDTPPYFWGRPVWGPGVPELGCRGGILRSLRSVGGDAWRPCSEPGRRLDPELGGDNGLEGRLCVPCPALDSPPPGQGGAIFKMQNGSLRLGRRESHCLELTRLAGAASGSEAACSSRAILALTEAL